MLARLVSGLIATAILLPVTWIGGWWFAALASAVVGVCLYEFFTMTMPEDGPSRVFGIALGVGLILFILSGSAKGEGGLAALAALVILPALWFLVRTGDVDTVASRMGLALTGLLWVAVLGGLSSSLAYLEEGFAWLVMAAAIAFGSDIGGFFVGRFFGRHKLYEKISPKKTWEGSIGGVFAATVVAFGFRAAIGPAIEASHLIVVAPLGAILGQLGDLAQSMLKRSVGVKDSGSIMPGHGGLFDRIDALLFVAPAVFLYARLVLGVPIAWLLP